MSTSTVIAEGLHFGEGPRWRGDRLWFSDFFDHAVKTCTPDGTVETIFTIDGRTSGLGWLPDGDLLAVSMLDQSVLRWRPGSEPVLYASLTGLATFHCNDMVVDAAGRAYVGNFGFDLDTWIDESGFGDAFKNAPSTTLARVDPDGSAHVAADDLRFPNGIVITPDGATMIVAETMAARLTAFDIAADGSLSNRRVWADLGRRIPDGICLDAGGRVWVANPQAHECFLVAEGGEIVDIVETTENCFACMLGGDDGRTLFLVTSRYSHHREAAEHRTGRIETIRVDTPGAGRP